MSRKLWGWCASLAVLIVGAAPAHAAARYNGPLTLYVGTCGFDGFPERDVDGNLLRVVHVAPGGNARWPAWSPDGTRLAYIREHFPDIHLRVMDADGTNDRNVGHLETTDIF